MPENTYKLVYTFSDYYLIINFFQPVLIMSILVIGFLFLKRRISPILLHELFLTLIALVFILYFMFYRDISKFIDINNVYKNNMASLVEGKIENLSPIPYNTRGFENFKLNEITFGYRDDYNEGCYNTTKSHGGFITHNGQKVKIFHVNQCIVELWIEK